MCWLLIWLRNYRDFWLTIICSVHFSKALFDCLWLGLRFSCDIIFIIIGNYSFCFFQFWCTVCRIRLYLFMFFLLLGCLDLHHDRHLTKSSEPSLIALFAVSHTDFALPVNTFAHWNLRQLCDILLFNLGYLGSEISFQIILSRDFLYFNFDFLRHFQCFR